MLRPKIIPKAAIISAESYKHLYWKALGAEKFSEHFVELIY